MAAKTLCLILIVVIIVCLMNSTEAAPQLEVTTVPPVSKQTPVLESFRSLMETLFTKFSTVL